MRAIATLMCVLAAGAARAEVVTFAGTAAAASIEFAFTVDTLAPDLNPDPLGGRYEMPGPKAIAITQYPGKPGRLTIICDRAQIAVFANGNASSMPGYTVRGLSCVDETLRFEVRNIVIRLALRPGDANAPVTDAPPTQLPVLSAFVFDHSLVFTTRKFEFYPVSEEQTVEANIESVITLPEPSTGLAALAALGVVAALRRRHAAVSAQSALSREACETTSRA